MIREPESLIRVVRADITSPNHPPGIALSNIVIDLPIGKAITNLLTSVFFFIFAGVLLVTSWIFAMDATRVSEVSFTDWRISYWPIKWAMVVGGVLLLLQGVSKFAQDIRAVAETRGA